MAGVAASATPEPMAARPLFWWPAKPHDMKDRAAGSGTRPNRNRGEDMDRIDSRPRRSDLRTPGPAGAGCHRTEGRS